MNLRAIVLPQNVFVNTVLAKSQVAIVESQASRPSYKGYTPAHSASHWVNQQSCHRASAEECECYTPHEQATKTMHNLVDNHTQISDLFSPTLDLGKGRQ
jgi:hypothetical protein